ITVPDLTSHSSISSVPTATMRYAPSSRWTDLSITNTPVPEAKEKAATIPSSTPNDSDVIFAHSTRTGSPIIRRHTEKRCTPDDNTTPPPDTLSSQYHVL